MKRLPSNVNIDTRLVANFRLRVKKFLKSGSLDTEGSAEIEQTLQQDEYATAVKAVKCCDDVEVLPPQVTVASGRKRKHRFRSCAEASVSKASGYTCKYCCGIGHAVRTCSSLRVLFVSRVQCGLSSPDYQFLTVFNLLTIICLHGFHRNVLFCLYWLCTAHTMEPSTKQSSSKRRTNDSVKLVSCLCNSLTNGQVMDSQVFISCSVSVFLKLYELFNSQCVTRIQWRWP